MNAAPSINFASDNVAGASPEVMAELTAMAQGNVSPYGEDAYTPRGRTKTGGRI